MAFAVLFAISPLAADAKSCRASFYGSESGNRTASGAKFHPMGISIALRSHNFGDYFRITYRGKSVIAIHNDYGPAAWTGRAIRADRTR